MGRFTDWLREKLGLGQKRVALPEAQAEKTQVPNNDFIARLKNTEIPPEQIARREQEEINKQKEIARQKDLAFGYGIMKRMKFEAVPELLKRVIKSEKKKIGKYNTIHLDEVDYAILSDIQQRRKEDKANGENTMGYLDESAINMIEVVNEAKKEAVQRARSAGEADISSKVIRKYIGNTAEVAKRMKENEKYNPRMA